MQEKNSSLSHWNSSIAQLLPDSPQKPHCQAEIPLTKDVTFRLLTTPSQYIEYKKKL